MYDVQYDSRQTLPLCLVFNMTERGKRCQLMCRWGWYREINSAISCGSEYDTERQSLPSCVMLNATEMQAQVEVCEEMMRGMPRGNKQKWRYKRDLTKNKTKTKRIEGGLLNGFRLLSCGPMAGRWAFAPIPGQIYLKGNDWIIFCVGKNPTFVCVWLLSLFFLAHFLSNICQGVHD